MVSIFNQVLADMEGFSPEESPDTREIISFLQKKLDDTSEHMEVLEIYHAIRQLSYNSHPDNRQYTDFLSNNKSKFNISSYFDVPASPKAVLGKWSLPEELQGNVVLDKKREWVVDRVVKGDLKENFVIIGEPGVGKSVILFEIFDRFMKAGNASILTTENIGAYHESSGMKLFYDDIPENRDMTDALKATDGRGIVVSARQEDWKEQCKELDGSFTHLTIPSFSKVKMEEVSRKLLDLSNIYWDDGAIDLLVKYAEGTPIYVWLLVKEMKNARQKELTVKYLRRNASKGMINYVGDLLHRLLKDGPDFKKGGYHTLTMLYFLSTYMRNKQCHTKYFGEVSDCLDEYTTKLLGSDFDHNIQRRVMYYLSGGGDIMRFPHDAWGDVLAKKGRENPFIPDITYMEDRIVDSEIFEKVMRECIPRAWKKILSRYNRMPNRTRISFLRFCECLLSNFRPSTLEEQGIDLKYLRELATQHSDIESSGVIISKLEHLGKTTSQNVINIQKMSGGHIGDNKEDLGGLSAEAMKEKRRYETIKAREETERKRIEREGKWDEKIADMTMGSLNDPAKSERKTPVKKSPEDEAKESFEKLKALYEKGTEMGIDVSPYRGRYNKIRGWLRFRKYERVEELLPALYVELEERVKAHEREFRSRIEGLEHSVDGLVDECLEKGLDLMEESERYERAKNEHEGGKLKEACAILKALEEELEGKLKEANKEDRKRKELFTELSKLAGNEFDLLPPPELEDSIGDDPFKAEADVARFRENIEAERKRRRLEAEERERHRKRALELNEKLEEKVAYSRKKKFNVFSGFNDRRRKVRDLVRSDSYETAIEELNSLIADLDEHIKKKEKPKEPAKPKELSNSIGMKFVKIPGKDYYMGKYTVTQKEWKSVMGATPWKGERYVMEGDGYPTTYISWNDCQQFVKKLNSKEGRNRYRLPTEEEWEHACRAGSTTKYYFGDDAGRLGDYAWYDKNADKVGEEYAHRVGQKKPNKWALYDMHGNVWEWTSTAEGSARVDRGGSWNDSAVYCVSSYRGRRTPDDRSYILGVRLVRSSD